MDHLIERRLANIEKEQGKVRHVLFGNGERGIDEIVRDHSRKLDEITTGLGSMDIKIDQMQTSLDAIAKDRTLQTGKVQGRVETLAWLKWGIGVLVALVALGGSLGLYRLDQRWQSVQQTLNALPSLPE